MSLDAAFNACIGEVLCTNKPWSPRSAHRVFGIVSRVNGNGRFYVKELKRVYVDGVAIPVLDRPTGKYYASAPNGRTRLEPRTRTQLIMVWSRYAGEHR
jgi:hypothetical protein